MRARDRRFSSRVGPTLAVALAIALAASVGCNFDTSVPPVGSGDAGQVDAQPTVDADPIGDSDNDGIANAIDNCPTTPNVNQNNFDGDAHGDACDNCPGVSNDDQADVIDGGDGIGDACDDQDSDGVVDVLDNCWQVPNIGQENGDADSFGDACDNCVSVDNEDQLASDGDSFGDACDICPTVDDEDQFDEDNDTVGDACDNCPSIRNANQNDVLDNDGVGDACDPRPNQAGDSILFFDGFSEESTGAPVGWYEAAGSGNASGTWSVSLGKLRQARNDNNSPATLWRGDIGSDGDGVVGDVLIEALVEAGGVATSNEPYLGLVAAYTDEVNTDRGYSCTVQATSGGTRLRFVEIELNAVQIDSTPEFSMSTGSLMQIVHYQHSGTTTVCQGKDELSEMGRSFTNNYANGEKMGAIGVVTSNIGASFRHITVYQLGGTISCPGSSLCF